MGWCVWDFVGVRVAHLTHHIILYIYTGGGGRGKQHEAAARGKLGTKEKKRIFTHKTKKTLLVLTMYPFLFFHYYLFW